MATLREAVKASSGLGEGIALRVHLQNLGSGSGGASAGVCLEIGSLASVLTETDTGFTLSTQEHKTVLIDRPDTLDIGIETISNTEYTSTLSTQNITVDKTDTDLVITEPSTSISKIVTNETIYKDNTDG